MERLQGSAESELKHVAVTELVYCGVVVLT